MDPHTIDQLFDRLTHDAEHPVPATREPIRIWSMSGVERLRYADDTTAVFKYAREPFTGEDDALRIAAEHAVPVPTVHTAEVLHRILGMIMTDLGEPTGKPNDTDGVTAAIRLHQAGIVPKLRTYDETAFTALPERARGHLAALRDAGRWTETVDIAGLLDALVNAAGHRGRGTNLPPFGFCHSEFHPTSLHISGDRWHLLDFARAFNGPGLIDLASWPGTGDNPDPQRVRALLEEYVHAGGHPDALSYRGGLPPQLWALGWHRVWIVEWFMDQAVRWVNDPATDPLYITAVHRHLREAAELLQL